ncbi:hypothetical protein BJV78DRAFT_1283636 [Lactifluus subvellereus]|nr:hypothetical protein BJV78DRAFT_1283636 [Lactifluus subvellereus]
MKAFTLIPFLFFPLSSVLGQQLLTTTNQAGNTIVVQTTTNAFGQPLTQILQTLAPGAVASTTSPTTAAVTATSTAATAAATTQAAVNQGPVGQPGATPENPGGPTPYVYTTTNANGNYIPVSATFTPSFRSTTPYTPTGSGTVLQYSAWLSMVGSNTGAANNPVASAATNPASRLGVDIGLLLGGISTAFMGVLGWLVVLM